MLIVKLSVHHVTRVGCKRLIVTIELYRRNKKFVIHFDIHMPVHRNIITNYTQQDAAFLYFISTDALHVSGGSSAHRQEHITVHTASGIAIPYCC